RSGTTSSGELRSWRARFSRRSRPDLPRASRWPPTFEGYHPLWGRQNLIANLMPPRLSSLRWRTAPLLALVIGLWSGVGRAPTVAAPAAQPRNSLRLLCFEWRHIVV